MKGEHHALDNFQSLWFIPPKRNKTHGAPNWALPEKKKEILKPTSLIKSELVSLCRRHSPQNGLVRMKQIPLETETVSGVLWRIFITRDQDNYMSIKQAIADFVENNPSVLQDIDAKRNADGTMFSPADFITKTRLKVDGYGYIDTDLYPLIALRFKVHIYILWSVDPKQSYWAHVAPGNEFKANDKHPSIMIRYTGKHNRIIKDVLPSASLTIDNDWNSCEFKVIAFPPERANLAKDKRTFSTTLLIDPKDADVQKIEQLITIQINHDELKSMKGKMAFSYINKDGVEEPIKPGQKLGSPPYNFACGGRQTIYARIKH
ncbi:hypothetical protein DdX_20983 [Ditylenchus destructor]|uniref:Uncharacterized protein n=1 Tax=Ditylenchus destructor TaxID=166010 RepID=A0AAD4MGE7_9BILA|nr:hypothetical protein DdX_20983 [Ditylenchus destructor]